MFCWYSYTRKKGSALFEDVDFLSFNHLIPSKETKPLRHKGLPRVKKKLRVKNPRQALSRSEDNKRTGSKRHKITINITFKLLKIKFDWKGKIWKRVP